MPKTTSNKIISLIPDSTVAASIVLAYYLDSNLPTVEVVPDPINLVGWLFVLAGIVLAVRSISAIRANNVTSNVTDVPSSLIKRGVYSFSRNPFYLSYIFIAMGAAIVLGSLSAFVGPALCILVLNLVVRFEEPRLKSAFGQEYQNYARSVRRWL